MVEHFALFICVVHFFNELTILKKEYLLCLDKRNETTTKPKVKKTENAEKKKVVKFIKK